MKFCFLMLLVSSPAANDTDLIHQAGVVNLMYTGNMGVLINSGKTAVWIDGLHEYYGPEYLNPPDSILEKAFAKTGSFSHLQWLLFTHYHRDHFSASLVKRFLQKAVHYKAAGAPQVTDSIPASHAISAWNKNGEIVNDPSSSLRIQAFNIPHTWPQRHARVQNIAYRVELNGIGILHIGDADTDPEAFEKIPSGRTDIMIVPSWYLQSEKGKKIIERFQAKKIIVTHIAPGERFKSGIDIKNAEIILFDKVGKSVNY